MNNQPEANRLTLILSVGVAAFVLAYFLTNLHRSAQTGQFAYTYNTLTGEFVTACYGSKCWRPTRE